MDPEQPSREGGRNLTCKMLLSSSVGVRAEWKMAHKGRLAGVLSGQGRYAGQELILPDLQVSTGQGKS